MKIEQLPNYKNYPFYDKYSDILSNCKYCHYHKPTHFITNLCQDCSYNLNMIIENRRGRIYERGY